MEIYVPFELQMDQQTAVANGTGGKEGAGSTRVGVLFAGRQASGGHNIIWGLHELFKGSDNKVH